MHFKYLRYFLVLQFCIFTIISHAQKIDNSKVFVIRNVNIIPMTLENKVMENATIVIEGNKIISINGLIPDSAEIIEGKGKWLIPGLIDMHVHIPVDGHFNTTYPTKAATIFTNTQDVMMPFIANGVTTVFDLNAKAGHFGQRNEILRGDIIGPRMALAAMIDGGSGDGRIANTASDGRQAVRMAKAEGYEFIKVYSQLNHETYNAIIDEADTQGMKVVGHIPNAFKANIEKAFISHFGLVAHAEEFAKQSEDYSDADIQRFAKLAKENGTWLIPTLTIIERNAEQASSLDNIRNLQGFKYVHPLLQSKWLTANQANQGTSPERVKRLEKMAAFNKRLVKVFNEEGVPILTGTDAGCAGIIWGFSLHDELALLVEAGMTPTEALVSATRLPTVWLGIEDKIGTVEVGKLADLVLLDANPLENINNTRKISGCFFDGKWINKNDIDLMLMDLAKRNSDNSNKFEWKKRKGL